MEGYRILPEDRVLDVHSLEAKHHSLETRHPLGTCFAFGRPGLFLTAAHVISDIPTDAISVASPGPAPKRWRVNSKRFHGAGDVAALYIDHTAQEQHPACFMRGVPLPGFPDFALGEDIIALGYPLLADERSVRMRIMKGHLQALYAYRTALYEYRAFELPFPAFPGQSGSPVIRDWARNEVIGVVTENVTYSSERGENRTDASWTLAASLAPLAEWLEAL